MSTILQNSIWPNNNGQLGNIKVAMPDGIVNPWPEGDALVGNFVYNEGKLVGFIDTKALTENEAKSTVLSYDYVNITLDARLESLLQIDRAENNKYLNINYEVQLPTGYKRLEYLESTGEQYIDTGYQPNNETGVMVNYQNVAWENTWVAAVYDVATDSRFYHPKWASPTSRLFGWGGFGYFSFSSDAERFFDRWQCELNFKNNRIASVRDLDDEFYREESLASYGTPAGSGTIPPFSESLPLFGRRDRGVVVEKSSVKLFSAQITQGENIIRDFIPALDPTGAPCMFNIISQEPFYNSGTGQFLYPGAESQVATTDLDENFYAKMTEHGIQKLYHVPEDFTGSKDEYAAGYGFKQLVEPPMPAEGYWTSEWIETDSQLICNWVETEKPKIETL